MRRGERLLSRGSRLGPYQLALLAAQGFETVPAARRPRAALVITGDELLKPGEVSRPGKIRDANGPALAGALSRWGVEIVFQALVGDRADPIGRALEAALNSADTVLLSGGVSMGDFDFTRSALKRSGVEEVFWRVAIKPGGPLLFARNAQGKTVFGLPGNPLSALVCLEEFVRPGVEKMQGATQTPASSFPLRGTVMNEFAKPAQKQQYLFCGVEGSPHDYSLRILLPQGSAMVRHAAQADALAVAPIGAGRIMPGDKLMFRWLS